MVSPLHTVSDSDSDTSADSIVANSPSPVPCAISAAAVKNKPPFFTIVPNYVPKSFEKLGPTVPLTVLGSITSTVDGCVVIKADPTAPAMDAGSALFLRGGEPLGEIYETFGPVSTPFYVVVLPNSPLLKMSANRPPKRKYYRNRHHHREEPTETIVIESDCEDEAEPVDRPLPPSLQTVELSVGANSPSNNESLCQPDMHAPASSADCQSAGSPQPKQQIDTPPIYPSVNPGDVVYFVKDDETLTIPVFYSQLIQMKGSDASWVNDQEPPPEELEFSDDEQERLHKRNLRGKRHQQDSTSTSTHTTVKPKPFNKTRRPSQRPQHASTSIEQTPSPYFHPTYPPTTTPYSTTPLVSKFPSPLVDTSRPPPPSRLLPPAPPATSTWINTTLAGNSFGRHDVINHRSRLPTRFQSCQSTYPQNGHTNLMDFRHQNPLACPGDSGGQAHWNIDPSFMHQARATGPQSSMIPPRPVIGTHQPFHQFNGFHNPTAENVPFATRQPYQWEPRPNVYSGHY